jgi:hypothetical protein
MKIKGRIKRRRDGRKKEKTNSQERNEYSSG